MSKLGEVERERIQCSLGLLELPRERKLARATRSHTAALGCGDLDDV